MGRRKGLFGWSSAKDNQSSTNNSNSLNNANAAREAATPVTTTTTRKSTVSRPEKKLDNVLSEEKSIANPHIAKSPIIEQDTNASSSSSSKAAPTHPLTYHQTPTQQLPPHPSTIPPNANYAFHPSHCEPTFPTSNYHQSPEVEKGGVAYMVIPPPIHQDGNPGQYFHHPPQPPEPMFVSPILDVSSAAEQLWRVPVPDFRGAIYAIQNLHQAIIHEASPYSAGYTLDPAEIFLCIQGVALRFHSYWEEQMQKKNRPRKKSRKKYNKSKTYKRQHSPQKVRANLNIDSKEPVNVKKCSSRNSLHSEQISVPSSADSIAKSEGSMSRTELYNCENISKKAINEVLHEKEKNEFEATKSRLQNIHKIENQPQSMSEIDKPASINFTSHHSSSLKATSMEKNNEIKSSRHSLPGNFNNRESASISASSATSTTNFSQATSCTLDAQDKSIFDNSNHSLLSFESINDMDEYFYQIWEESIATTAILSNLLIGPAWRNQVKQRRMWLKNGRVRKGEKRADDSVSSLGMSSVKRQANKKQQNMGQLSSNGTSRLTSNSSFPYFNDETDQGGSSCSGSIGSNPQSAAKIKHNKMEPLYKGVDSWNSQENHYLDEDTQFYPLIPEVLPTAILRFTAIVTESFFPPIKRQNTPIKLPKRYDLFGIEIQKEQRWLIRRQRIGAVQREIVLSLCSWDDNDETIEDQSIRSGKSIRNINSQFSNNFKYSWTFPGSHSSIASMILFWLDTATTRWPELYSYLEQDDPDFEDAIEDLRHVSADTGEVLWEDIAEVGAIDWWYALQACRAAADLVVAGWKPPPKQFGPQCVLGLLSIAERGMWLFAPHMIDLDGNDVMKFDLEDTQQEAREERLAAASCAAEAMSTLTCLGTRGALPILAIESVVKGLCSILSIADSANNYEVNIDRYPLPDFLSPDIGNDDDFKEELELEKESFYSQWNSYLTDTAELLWVMVAHHTSACSTTATLLNITNIRLYSQESLSDDMHNSCANHNSTILATGGAIRALGAALWGNPTQVKGIPSLRIYWKRFLEVLSKVSASLHEEKSDESSHTNGSESFKTALNNNSISSLPSAISINHTKSSIPTEPENVIFTVSKLRNLREYSSSSLIVFLETVLALRRLVDGEMIHGIDTLCADEWESFIYTLSDGLLPWLDHSYAEKVGSVPCDETEAESRNHVLVQRIHSEVLAIFHQVHLFLTFPVNTELKVSSTHHVILDENCRRRMFILFLREALPMLPIEQSKSLSISLIKSWAFGGPLFSRHHTWYRTISDILMEAFAVYDDQSYGYPGGYLHPPCIQIVALESIMEHYFIQYGCKRFSSVSQKQTQLSQIQSDEQTLASAPNSTADEVEMKRIILAVKNNILSNQIVSLLITFQTEALQYWRMASPMNRRESLRTVLPSTSCQNRIFSFGLQSTTHFNDRLQLSITAVRILADLFRRPSTEKRDRISILDIFHAFATDLTFLSNKSQTNISDDRRINDALTCRLEIISQLGLCLRCCFEENSHIHFTAPMIVDQLSDLIHVYSKISHDDEERSMVDVACSSNVTKLLVYACFLHLACLRRTYDGQATLESLKNVANSSLRILMCIIAQIDSDNNHKVDFRKHLHHIFDKAGDGESTLFAPLVFWQINFEFNSKSKEVQQGYQTTTKPNVMMGSLMGTSLNFISFTSTIKTALEIATQSINSKSELVEDNGRSESCKNQLVLSYHFDISIRVLCNKTMDGILRSGVSYPLDLSLHMPKYDNCVFYDDHRTLDFRTFSELLATSNYLINKSLVMDVQPYQSEVTSVDGVINQKHFTNFHAVWHFLINSLSFDDFVVSSNCCKCLSVLVAYHCSNNLIKTDTWHEETYTEIVSESLKALADSLLGKLEELKHFSNDKNGEASSMPASIHEEAKKHVLGPILSALFDIITESTSKKHFASLPRETKSHIFNVCFQSLCRQNEHATTCQSRLLAMQCLRALICIMDAHDIIFCMAFIVKLEKDDTKTNIHAAEGNCMNFCDLIVDMLNCQNARVLEKQMKIKCCPLSMNQKMSKEIEDLEAFSVEEHESTGIAAWLCGNSILMLRKGSPTSRFRGWLEITVRSPTSRARKLIKLSSLLHVRNPEFPSPLWDLLLPQSSHDTLTSSPSENVKTKCDDKIITAATNQIHRYELFHGCHSLDSNDGCKQSSHVERNYVPKMVSISNLSPSDLINERLMNSSESSEPSITNEFYQSILKKQSNDDISHKIFEHRRAPSNDDFSHSKIQSKTVLKRSYSAGDIVHQMETIIGSGSVEMENYSSVNCVNNFLKSFIGDSTKDLDSIMPYLNLQGLIPMNDKIISTPLPSSVSNKSLQRLKYSFRLRRAIDILDRTTFLQTYKIALLYAGSNIGQSKTESDGLSEAKNESIILGTENASPQFLEFCRGLGEHVPTRHLKHFSGGLDTSTYSADGKFAISWIDENIYSDGHSGHLFSHSMILFHTIPLMPSGINNRKRHVGNDNIHVVYVDDVNDLGPGLSISDIGNTGTKRDPVISGEFGFATIFVVPLSVDIVNITLKLRSKLDKRLSCALDHLVGTTIVSKGIAPSFVRQLAMRADLACRSSMQDSLGNFSNWQERLHQINDFVRYIEK